MSVVSLRRQLHKCKPYPLWIKEHLFVGILLSTEYQHSTEKCTSVWAVWVVTGVWTATARAGLPLFAWCGFHACRDDREKHEEHGTKLNYYYYSSLNQQLSGSVLCVGKTEVLCDAAVLCNIRCAFVAGGVFRGSFFFIHLGGAVHALCRAELLFILHTSASCFSAWMIQYMVATV